MKGIDQPLTLDMKQSEHAGFFYFDHISYVTVKSGRNLIKFIHYKFHYDTIFPSARNDKGNKFVG